MKKTCAGMWLTSLIAVFIAACGGGDRQAQPATAAAPMTASSDEVPSRVCSLLTKEQVDTVIPGHDGGRDKDTSEASLLRDVKMEHCQYLVTSGDNLGFLDVLVYTATSEAGLASLPGGLTSCTDSDCRRLDIGDNSFATTRNGDPRLVVAKGGQYLEISLSAPDAAAKSAELVELARAAAGKL